jgi:hypothetical protein
MSASNKSETCFVKSGDDLMAATRYGVMMLRHASFDGRRKVTQRGGLSTTALASLLLGELARERPDMQR